MTPDSPTRDAREPEATVALDENGVVVAVDDAAEALLGGRPVLGHPLADLAVESERPALRTLLVAVRPDGPALRATFGLRCADGRVLHTAIVATATTDPAAAPGVTVLLRDVSSQRSTEQALAATQAVIGAMARSQAPDQALQSVVASLGTSMGWAGGGYWRLSADDATLERVLTWSAAGIDAGAIMPESYALAGSLTERAFRAGEAQWTTDLAAETVIRTAVAAGESGLHSAVAVPTTRMGAATGVIAFLSSSPRPLDPHALAALSIAGIQVGELLGMLQERGDAVDSLRRLALTDELTGLPNRRAWEEAVRRELARAVRDRHPVCIAVLDLDGFKRFNDEHGHQAGDRVLADSARAWQSQLRGSDLLARYGGEEFAALIPAWPLEIAVEVVERLRLATAGGLTASAGVASWDGSETGEELFGRADAALYEAKQSGRDRTVAAR
jgi:diguanylate cyclase (GGDEF)-like protein/PAS domain S-box-containing protein